MTRKGKLVVFSAPSGSGKTTIVRHLLKKYPTLGFSISACTRPKREKVEEDGKDYYFLSVEEFKQKIDDEGFVEWEEVYAGNYYGTLKEEIERKWANGKDVIFDVDVKGGLNIKKAYPDQTLAIFVKVPDHDILKARLMARGTESEESIKRRMHKMKFESTFEDQFDLTIVNDNLQSALDKADQVVGDFLNS